MENTQPTNAELEILNILWEENPLTVKEIHERLAESKDIGYTTALKLMQVMTTKGFLDRVKEGKRHLYSPAIQRDATRKSLLNRFVDTAFAGSSSSLVMQLLGNKKNSKEDLKAIKKIIEDMEKNQ
jgi:predicted transcriptional regulator